VALDETHTPLLLEILAEARRLRGAFRRNDGAPLETNAQVEYTRALIDLDERQWQQAKSEALWARWLEMQALTPAAPLPAAEALAPSFSLLRLLAPKETREEVLERLKRMAPSLGPFLT
jgi:hypothetical protein